MHMQFEWDDAKSDATFEARGFDFAYAAMLFDDPFRIEREDDRKDYGEPRWQTIGLIEGEAIFVAFTMRGDVTRIISARRAHDNEEKQYHASHR